MATGRILGAKVGVLVDRDATQHGKVKRCLRCGKGRSTRPAVVDYVCADCRKSDPWYLAKIQAEKVKP